MTYQLTTQDILDHKVAPFGVADESYGIKFHDHAVAFIKMFPVGSRITMGEFDNFAICRGVDAPRSQEKSSDGWKAFLQRRHEFKYNLNKAAANPRLGDDVFYVAQDGNNRLVVKHPHVAAVEAGLPKQLKSLFETKRKAIKHLVQSVDFNQLTPAQQVTFGMLAKSIENFKMRLTNEANMLESDFNEARSEVLHLVQIGHIVPKNGGIKALISDSEFENEPIKDIAEMGRNF